MQINSLYLAWAATALVGVFAAPAPVPAPAPIDLGALLGQALEQVKDAGVKDAAASLQGKDPNINQLINAAGQALQNFDIGNAVNDVI